MKSGLRRSIYDIVVNTFEVACYMHPLEISEVEDQKMASPDEPIHSIVEFDGAAEGKMIITPSDDLLSEMTKNMLAIENPDKEQMAGALGEVSNIICGNTVPLFTGNDDICYIHPPQIVKEWAATADENKETDKGSLKVFLDGGVVEITVYCSIKEKL